MAIGVLYDWIYGSMQDMIYFADAEIRMDDGALRNDVSERNQSWEDSGTISSDT